MRSVAIICVLGGSAAAAVTETSTTPYPGIVHTVRTDTGIPAVAHILTVDLSSAELRVVTTEEDERGQTVSDWAAAAGVSVAVNGDVFDPFTFAPDGLAMGGGGVWGISSDDAIEGFVSFDRAMDMNHAFLEPPETIVMAADLAPAIDSVVGGRPMLVRGGVPELSFDCGDPVTIACERAPRTAVGLSEDRRTMYLVVVDGWQPSSHGLTAAELADLVHARGAHDALALDPGSSSAMYVQNQGGVVSSPSDGAERAVANHIGVRHGALPPGTMIGFVRERDIFDDTANIAGATVTLDDGQTAVTGADGRYSFNNLTPRLVCATADHPDYHAVTQCRDVPSAGTVFNSIALFPNSDFIDAAPGLADAAPPDARIFPDADLGPDGAVGPDAGEPPGAPSACGCSAGGRPGTRSACILLAVPAMLLLGRRRRA